MRTAILLTGPPGCGKTTAIQSALARLACPASGFYTQEIRQGGSRMGFNLVTLDGREGILAHTGVRGGPRVGRYGVDLAVMDSLAVEAVRRGIVRRELIVIDEIGPMELLSRAFQAAVLEALEADLPVLGTIMRRSAPFADAVKARPDVRLIGVQRNRLTSVVEQIVGLLDTQKSAGCA